MEQSNALEQALSRAADNPANRPEFYRMLLDSQIYAIGHSAAAEAGRSTVPAGASLSFATWKKGDGTEFIPFFTSLEALQRSLTMEAQFLAVPARSFFEITRGQSLILNPNSPCGKEFYPAEVDSLLTTGVNHTATQRTLRADSKVLLGQPAKFPSEMVNALIALLKKHRTIKAAYLCLMHDQAAESAPSLVVGFESEGDVSAAIRDAGSVAADTAPAGQAVDFMVLTRGQSAVSAYMLESVKPFYERR